MNPYAGAFLMMRVVRGPSCHRFTVSRFLTYSLHGRPGQSRYGVLRTVGCGPEHEIPDDRRSPHNLPPDRGSPRVSAGLRA